MALRNSPHNCWSAKPALDRDQVVGEIVGPKAFQVWESWSIEKRRACVKAILELRVGRGRKGPVFSTAGLEQSRWIGDERTWGDHLALFGIEGGYVDGTNVGFLLWRICSAVAHGDTWVLPMFDIDVIEEFSAGVGVARVTAPTELVLTGVRAAFKMVDEARTLYVQRAGL